MLTRGRGVFPRLLTMMDREVFGQVRSKGEFANHQINKAIVPLCPKMTRISVIPVPPRMERQQLLSHRQCMRRKPVYPNGNESLTYPTEAVVAMFARVPSENVRISVEKFRCLAAITWRISPKGRA
jgi:hypothetical protein